MQRDQSQSRRKSFRPESAVRSRRSRRHVLPVVLGMGLLAFAPLTPAEAQVSLGSYTFNGNNENGTASFSDLTYTSLVRTNVNLADTNNVYRTDSWTTGGSIDTSEHLSFTVTPATGYQIQVASLNFDALRDANGPTTLQLRHSANSYGAGPANHTVTTSNTGFNTNFVDFTSASAVTFRIHGWSAPTSAGRLTLDNIAVQGLVQPRASLNTSVASSPASRVMLNTAGVTYDVSVQNNALTGGNTGAQGLDYALALSGVTGVSINAPTSGTGLAGAATASHTLLVDTSTTGAKGGGTVDVSSSNAYRANGTVGDSEASLSLNTINVVANRTITTTPTINMGNILVGQASTAQTVTLSSAAARSVTADVTFNSGSYASSSGVTNGTVTIAAGSAYLFNGTNTSTTRSLTGIFTTAGTRNETVTFAGNTAGMFTTEAGLTGQTAQSVSINYTANVYEAAALSTNNASPLGEGASVTITNAPGSHRAKAVVDSRTISNGRFSLSNLNPGSQINPGNSGNATIAVNKAGLLNGQTITGNLSVKLENDQSILGTQNQDLGTHNWSLSQAISGNVGDGTADVAAAGSYAGLSGTSHKELGNTAIFLAGSNNNGGATTVGVTWRDRTPTEKTPSGMIASDNFKLISDVSDITGTDGDIFVMQIAYDPAQLPTAYSEAYAAANGLITIVTSGGGLWSNTIDFNHGVNTTNPALLNYQGSWSTSGAGLTLGAWGVDITSHIAWAVIDHNSEFAIGTQVPEPASFTVLAMGSLLMLRRRRA